jgi:superfamily II DNA/RNA helicase
MPAGQPRTARPRRSRPHTAPSRAPGTTFAALGVATALVTVLARDGITAPRPIQAAVLPDALAGRDILGCAQTGSGKTLGFSLPLVARLAGRHTMACRPRGLVLVPTRELATQVEAVLSAARLKGLVSGRAAWICQRRDRACGQASGASTQRGGVYWSWL